MNNIHNKLLNGVSAETMQTAHQHAEMRMALEEFNTRLPSFCRQLNITPAQLNLRLPELIMLICMRQQNLIDTLRADLDELRRVAVTKEP